MRMKVAIVIPARYGSTRFPGKLLKPLGGAPLLRWVWERAARARCAQRVIVATDDERIAQVVRGFGGEVVMTSPKHPSGTDRIAEVARRVEAQVYVNVQGDEPLIEPREIDRLVKQMGEFPMATLAHRIGEERELALPQVVKVVMARDGRALYFSRAAIPHYRDPGSAASFGAREYWRHIGIYAYTAEALAQLVRWKPSPLERAEALEQLRALENGLAIKVVATPMRCVGVDTPEDLAHMERQIKEQGLEVQPHAAKRRRNS